MTDPDHVLLRSEVPVEQTWDLERIYLTPDDWLAAYHDLESMLGHLSEFQGRLGEGPAMVLAYFKVMEKTFRAADKIYVYASLTGSGDTTDQTASAREGQARSLYAKAEAAAAFAEPELMAIGFDTLREWLKADPEMVFLEHYIERLEKRAKHLRSGEVEEVLALAGDALGTPSAVWGMLTNADLQFSPARSEDGSEREVTQSSINGLITGPDRSLRRTAWESYADGYLKFKNTFAASLTGAIKRDALAVPVRGYGSSLEASLAPEHIPSAVFHNLIAVFKKNLPTWHRYWRIRKKMMGVDKLHFYDTSSPLCKNPPKVSFEQAVEWIAAGMRPLGDEYAGILRKGCLEDRWVDWAVNKGKRGGAFSSGSYDTSPYILMSFAGDVFSLSTLAHELGHSLHSDYSKSYQPYLYAGYSLFVAEVASNFNQAMTRAYLFETMKDPDFQLALVDEAMANFRRYFFIMPTLARFELEMHERVERGQPTNADALIDLCAGLFKEGLGDEVEFDQQRMGIQWAEFVHLYYNFYVYQYATGISAAQALSEPILRGEPGAAKRYLEFLQTGGSRFALDTLKIAGVDLSQPEPVERAFAGLAEIVDRLEALAG